MNNETIKRYIYAVACNLPAKAQPEVEREMESMVSELLDARCGGAEPGEEDVRAVLVSLGPPEELAVKYAGDENKALISGVYLLWYKKFLKIILPVAALGVALAMFLSALVKWKPPQEPYGFLPEAIGSVVSGGVEAAVFAFMWITVVFVILERCKVKFTEVDFISKLRPVPDKRAQIKLHDPFVSIMWYIAAATLLLGFPKLIGGYSEASGWIPAFDEAFIRSAWYLVIIWTASGVVRETVKLTERRYSKKLAIVTLAANLISGLSAAVFFADSRLMNPAFVANVGSMLEGEDAAWIGMVLGYANVMILAAILFALSVETVVTAYRAFKYV